MGLRLRNRTALQKGKRIPRTKSASSMEELARRYFDLRLLRRQLKIAASGNIDALGLRPSKADLSVTTRSTLRDATPRRRRDY